MADDAQQIIFEYEKVMFKFRYSKSNEFLGIYVWCKDGYVEVKGWKSDGSLEIIKKIKYFFNSLELPEENNEE